MDEHLHAVGGAQPHRVLGIHRLDDGAVKGGVDGGVIGPDGQALAQDTGGEGLVGHFLQGDDGAGQRRVEGVGCRRVGSQFRMSTKHPVVSLSSHYYQNRSY